MVFMVFFYFAAGIFIIWFFEASTLDKAIRVILGSLFLFLGVFRAIRAYEKIKSAYFMKDKNEENGSRKYRIGRYKKHTGE